MKTTPPRDPPDQNPMATVLSLIRKPPSDDIAKLTQDMLDISIKCDNELTARIPLFMSIAKEMKVKYDALRAAGFTDTESIQLMNKI